MSTYNIEMNTYNGTTYDQIYPQTLLNNIVDWSNSIYSKNEVNNLINTFKSNFNYLLDILYYTGTGSSTQNITLPKNSELAIVGSLETAPFMYTNANHNGAYWYYGGVVKAGTTIRSSVDDKAYLRLASSGKTLTVYFSQNEKDYISTNFENVEYFCIYFYRNT